MRYEQRRRRGKKSHRKKISISKLYWMFVFLDCVIVEIYAMCAMWKMQDLSSLYVLIGPPLAAAFAFREYEMKSKAENTRGGVIHDIAMNEYSDPTEITNSEEERP